MRSYKWSLSCAATVFVVVAATGCKGPSYSAAQAKQLRAESQVFVVQAQQSLERAEGLRLRGQHAQALAALTGALDRSSAFLEIQLEEQAKFEHADALHRFFDLGDLLQVGCALFTKRAQVNYEWRAQAAFVVDYQQLLSDLRSVVRWHDGCDMMQNKLSDVDRSLSRRAQALMKKLDSYAFQCHSMLAELYALGLQEELMRKHSKAAARIVRQRPDLDLRA